jgi:hypothetical protein
MSERKKKITTLVVCVGTGGVFYHGLSMMSNFIQSRGNAAVLLLDDDKVEDKNRYRQWGFGVGESKVSVAEKILSPLTGGCLIGTAESRIEDAESLQKAVLRFAEEVNSTDEFIMTVDKTYVLHSPDNHLCRVLTHEGCKSLAVLAKKPVIEITGGNTVENGYAYGCRHEDSKCIGDFLTRHPDIVESSKAELLEIESPQPCGSLGESVEQTSHSNSLTANCMWSLAERMSRSNHTGEVIWSTDEDNRVWIHQKEVE